MNHYIAKRAVQEGNYIVSCKCTVRECAKHFGVSKSTVHVDVTKRLRNVNFQLYVYVLGILNTNLIERHIRGGNATRTKYNTLASKEVK